MDDWTFQNRTQSSQKISLKSIDHGIELFMEASGENEYGVCLEFHRHPKGLVDCIAGPGYATLSFDPDYDHVAGHSRISFVELCAGDGEEPHEPFYFVDDTESASCVDAQYLVPILDAVSALRYILEFNDICRDLRWK